MLGHILERNLMRNPNRLVFVDFPSNEIEKSAKFYEKVFGWNVERRVPDRFCRIVPGGFYKNPDNTDSEINNLHMGLFNVENARPHPTEDSTEPRTLSSGRTTRAWILVSEDDTQDRILETAERLGAKILWKDHYWHEFNGHNSSFVDPWGNQIMLWSKPEDAIEDYGTHTVVGEPNLPEHWTQEYAYKSLEE